jgi:hypothetical protein
VWLHILAHGAGMLHLLNPIYTTSYNPVLVQNRHVVANNAVVGHTGVMPISIQSCCMVTYPGDGTAILHSAAGTMRGQCNVGCVVCVNVGVPNTHYD